MLRNNFRRFKYLLLRFCLHFINFQDAPHPLITLRSWQLPSVYTIKMARHSQEKVVIPMLIRCKVCHFLEKVSPFE